VHPSFWTAIVISTAIALDPRAASALGRLYGRVEALACAPTDPEVAAAVVDGVVWITRDGGASWRSARRLDLLRAEPTEEPADAASTEDVTEEEPAETDEPTAPVAPAVILAVGDRGEWAAGRAEKWVVDSGSGIFARTELGGAVSGLAFDASSRLWVAAGDRLAVFEGRRRTNVVAVTDAGPPVAAGDAGAVLVPGALGLTRIHFGADGDVSAQIVGPPAEAVAVDPDDGATYTVSRGAISRIGDGGEASFVARAPVRASRLVIAGGALWVLSGGRWFTSSPLAGLKPTSVRAIAADARGRLWLGADRGPVPPKERVASGIGKAAFPVAPGRDIDFARRLPPPCPRPIAAILPDAALMFGFGLDEVASSTVDNRTDTAGTRSWLAVGLTLTWELKPVVDAKCEARLERFAEREEERLARQVELCAELARARAAKASAQTIAGALSATITADTLLALIAALGGRKPEEKENRK